MTDEEALKEYEIALEGMLTHWNAPQRGRRPQLVGSHFRSRDQSLVGALQPQASQQLSVLRHDHERSSTREFV